MGEQREFDHRLILGASKFGKTTLAMQFAELFRAAGVKVGALDPDDSFAPADFRTCDADKFLRWAKLGRRCALFIDDFGDAVGRGKVARGMEWYTTRGRKWGHVVHLLAQDLTQIDPIMRRMCHTGYIFRQTKQQAQLLVNHFAREELMATTQLERFEFMEVHAGDPRVRRRKLEL